VQWVVQSCGDSVHCAFEATTTNASYTVQGIELMHVARMTPFSIKPIQVAERVSSSSGLSSEPENAFFSAVRTAFDRHAEFNPSSLPVRIALFQHMLWLLSAAPT